MRLKIHHFRLGAFFFRAGDYVLVERRGTSCAVRGPLHVDQLSIMKLPLDWLCLTNSADVFLIGGGDDGDQNVAVYRKKSSRV